MAGQLFQSDNGLGAIIQTLFSVAFIFYLFYARRIQAMTMLRKIQGALRMVKGVRDESRQIAVEAVEEVGGSDRDAAPMVERFTEHFMIQPVDMDPSGVVGKLGQLLDVREQTYESEVRMMAPEASESQVDNLENLLEVALALNVYYKVLRHFYLMGKRTMNVYIIMQIQMILPQLLELIQAHTAALQAFKEGMPIGDSVGAVVAAKLMHGYEHIEVAEETVAAEVPFNGRTLVVTKARGPGGNVGKPGDAVENILDNRRDRVRLVITIDGARKLEGETTGEVAEGVGAAIGGAGVERYKIEEVANNQDVPLYAVAIKEGIKDVIAPLAEELLEATDKAVHSVHRLVHEYSDEGDTVIVAGIGNTVGVAQ